MRRFIYGTIRPISFLAWIPDFIGSLLAGTLSWHFVLSGFGAVLCVGFANSFNNLLDRKIDGNNPEKKTMAVSRPMLGYWFVLAMIPLLAVSLHLTGYNSALLAVLYYVSFWYSYLFGRIVIVKRITVAVTIAVLCFLQVRLYNPWVWGWALLVAIYIYRREGRKDMDDVQEDQKVRFFRREQLPRVDWWCVSAPLLAIVLLCISWLPTWRQLGLTHMVMAIALTIQVWSYIQIRSKYGAYRMRLQHRILVGVLGILMSLIGFVPMAVSVPSLLLVWIVALLNSVTMAYRAFQPRWVVHTWLGVFHDAYLWASVVILAMLSTTFSVLALVVASVVFTGVVLHEYRRLRPTLAF